MKAGWWTIRCPDGYTDWGGRGRWWQRIWGTREDALREARLHATGKQHKERSNA